jgi:hypothetical protein
MSDFSYELSAGAQLRACDWMNEPDSKGITNSSKFQWDKEYFSPTTSANKAFDKLKNSHDKSSDRLTSAQSSFLDRLEKENNVTVRKAGNNGESVNKTN